MQQVPYGYWPQHYGSMPMNQKLYHQPRVLRLCRCSNKLLQVNSLHLKDLLHLIIQHPHLKFLELIAMKVYVMVPEIQMAINTINQRFKNKETKYSGTDEKPLQDFINAYLTAAEDYRLSPFDRLQFSHNLFRGDALRFYTANVKGRYRSFVEAVKAIYAHFNARAV